MKKWVVINQIKNCDDFSKVMESKEAAIKEAENIFAHLSESEKKNQILEVAEMEIDADEEPDWMTGYTPFKSWLE